MRTTNFIHVSMGLMVTTALFGCDNTPQKTETPSSVPSTAAGKMPKMDHSAHSDMNHSSMSHAMGDSGLKSLRAKTGKDFDIAFLSQMIAHHEAAVQMAKQALSTATKPETKAEAQKVIDSQSKEITQMTGWLKSWYGTTPNKPEQALVNSDMKEMMAMPVTTDAMFYDMMIPHHQGAIDMSELAPKNAGRAEVKALAQQIITAQKAEIEKYHSLM